MSLLAATRLTPLHKIAESNELMPNLIDVILNGPRCFFFLC